MATDAIRALLDKYEIEPEETNIKKPKKKRKKKAKPSTLKDELQEERDRRNPFLQLPFQPGSK